MAVRSNSTTPLRHAGLEPLEERTVRSVNPIAPPAAAEAVVSAPESTAVNTSDVEAAATVAALFRNATSVKTASLSSYESNYGLSGYGQTVAVIDTGIAWDHQALGGGLGGDYRVVGGWDFAENDSDPYDDGVGSHGTHVAGIVASDDLGRRGVAPGADIVGLRVFDDNGAGSFAWIEQALSWVHVHRNDFEFPITTVNISVGSNWNDASSVPYWTTLEDEFAQLKSDGIFVSVSAGNSFRSYNSAGLSYPASSPHVVPVAATSGSSVAYYSQRDDRVLAAPGHNVVSTVPDHKGNRDGIGDDYRAMSGTSMAAPYVSGASAVLREALLLAGHTDVHQDELYNHFRNTADLVYDAATRSHYHKINIERAIQAVLPVDEAGSAHSASPLGTMNGATAVEGMLTSVADEDYYSFVANQSGTAKLDFNWLGHTNGQAQLLFNGRAIHPGESIVSLVAGQTYTIGLTGQATIGRYEVVVSMESSSTPPREDAPGSDQPSPPPVDDPTNPPANDDRGSRRRAPIAAPVAKSEAYLTWTAGQTGYFRVELDIAGASLADDFTLTRDDGRQLIRYGGSVGDQQFYMAGQAGTSYQVLISSRVPLDFSFSVAHDDFSGRPLQGTFAFATAAYQSEISKDAANVLQEPSDGGEIDNNQYTVAPPVEDGGGSINDAIVGTVIPYNGPAVRSQSMPLNLFQQAAKPNAEGPAADLQHGLAAAMDAVHDASDVLDSLSSYLYNPDIGETSDKQIEEDYWRGVEDVFDSLQDASELS